MFLTTQAWRRRAFGLGIVLVTAWALIQSGYVDNVSGASDAVLESATGGQIPGVVSSGCESNRCEMWYGDPYYYSFDPFNNCDQTTWWCAEPGETCSSILVDPFDNPSVFNSNFAICTAS